MMAKSWVGPRAVPAQVRVRKAIRSRLAIRRRRLALEPLEPRLVMDGGPPHGGGGTLFDEHEAVMRLVDFEAIHAVPAGGDVANSYFIARDNDGVADGAADWRNPDNWARRVYDGTTRTWSTVAAGRLPGTGDDVDIPAGLTVRYDLGPGALDIGGQALTVRQDLRLHSVGVGGNLVFAPDADALFYVETMVVRAEGSWQATESDPTKTARVVIAAPDWARFSLAEPFDDHLDPLQFGRGIISHGRVRLTGSEVTPSVTVAQLTRSQNTTVNESGRSITVARLALPDGVPRGWDVGDRVVVAATDASRIRPANGASGDEEGVIYRIDAGANGSATLLLRIVQNDPRTGVPANPSSPSYGGLQYDHVPPKGPDGQPYRGADGNPLFGVQVANLSRNVVIQSEDPFHVPARGHVMFMHNTDVNVANVGFYGLGRTDKRTVVDDVQLYTPEIIAANNQGKRAGDPGWVPPDEVGHVIPGTGLNPRSRYPVHFHRAGIDETDPSRPALKRANGQPVAPASLTGSVVVDSPGWGIVNHTSYANIDNNITFNVVGAGFVGEAGNEMGRFSGNLAIKGVGANTREGIEARKTKNDFGFQGDGFWFQGPALDVRDNVAASQRHSGFVYFTQPLTQKYTYNKQVGTTNGQPAFAMVSENLPAKLTTTMLADAGAYEAIKPGVVAALGGTGRAVGVGAVPILRFADNTATAVGDGFESWFHLLSSGLPRDLGSLVTGLKVGATRGTGMFTPYTNLMTIRDAALIGNPANTRGTGINRNGVTANMTYDNLTVRGFDLGIAVPVNGRDEVLGGTFQNDRNLEITTANSRTREVLIADGRAGPLTFLAPKNVPNYVNVDLKTNYNPRDRDIARMFNPDVVVMGTVWLDSFALTGLSGRKQLYYYEQRGGFRPFPANDPDGTPHDYGGPRYDQFGNLVNFTGIEVPPELLDRTNAQLMSTFGLAIGGVVAPEGPDAPLYDGMATFAVNGGTGTASPRIRGLIGELATYQLAFDTTSADYTRQTTDTDPPSAPQYVLRYRVANDAANTSSRTVTVKVGNLAGAVGYSPMTVFVNGAPVAAPTPAPNLTARQLSQFHAQGMKLPLRAGWNLVTGNFDGTGASRSALIYGDRAAPELNLTTPDRYQLRRQTVDASGNLGWTPGAWNQATQAMSGQWATNGQAASNVAVQGRFVAVMHPNDLAVGFALRGQVIDNSFGSRSFGLFIGNLRRFLQPVANNGTPVPYLEPDSTIANYETFRAALTTPPGGTPPAPVYVTQRLQNILFTVTDWAGNAKTFALTIYLDPTAPRTGGDANPSGTFNPSASMIALGDLYVIDEETRRLISGTAPPRN